MQHWLEQILSIPWRFHFWGSLFIVIFIAVIISGQVTDRFGFANSELHNDVIQRWGAPILQPVPSARYVASGTVFSELKPLAFNRQRIEIDADMNYRKRGLVYFSGFDFLFKGLYELTNPEDHSIDTVFVFPVSLSKNKILLSELQFSVNGENQSVALPNEADKFIWTGRLNAKEKIRFEVRFSGRGLEQFSYLLDPSLPVRDFQLAINISGEANYDYPSYVAPATEVSAQDGKIRLQWDYLSLESGVPLGVILPTEKSFDQIISTMLIRSWVPFILLFTGLVGLCHYKGYRLKIYESYLVAACYGFFFVLLAYLAAFMNFYFAYATTLLILLLLMTVYLKNILGQHTTLPVLGLLTSFLVLPTSAVILQGYTGLIYTIGILLGLIALMYLTRLQRVQDLIDNLVINNEVKSDVS